MLELQRAAGNAAVTRLLQRVRYKSTASQGFKTQLDTGAADKTVEQVTFGKSYHGPQPHRARGDHGTAMVTFKHLVENAVRGVDHATAVAQLRDVALGVLGLPGMQAPKASQIAATLLDQALDELLAADKKPPQWDRVATAMDLIIAARNMTPLSAKTHAKSTKGGGEASKSGGLQWGEKQFQKLGKTDYVLQPGDMQHIWGLLEMRKRPVTSTEPDEIAAYIQQHLYTMRMAYPHMIGPDDYEDLIDYAFKHVWSETAGTAYMGFDDEAKAIEKLVRKAVLTDHEQIQYVDNTSKRWTADAPTGMDVYY